MAYYNYEGRKKGSGFENGKFKINPRQESEMKADQVISESKSNETPLEKEKLVEKVNPREVAEAKVKEEEMDGVNAIRAHNAKKKPKLVDEEVEEPFLKQDNTETSTKVEDEPNKEIDYYSNYNSRPDHESKDFQNNKAEVLRLQKFLNKQNPELKLGEDGEWGENIDRAYKDFKSGQSKGLDTANATSVANTVNDLSNVTIKGDKKGKGKGELSGEFGITKLLADRTNVIIPALSKSMPNANIRITAGNDQFHQERYQDKDKKKYKKSGGKYSKHQEGNSLDFTPFNYGIKVSGKDSRQPTKQEWVQIDAMEAELEKQLKANPGSFSYINEYKSPTAPFGHFHIEALDPKTGKTVVLDKENH